MGVDDPEFRNFAGIFSDKIFDVFYQFAKVEHEERNAVAHRRWMRPKLRLEHQVEGDQAFFPRSSCRLLPTIQVLRSGRRSTPSSTILGTQKSIGTSTLALASITTGSFDLARYDLYEANYEMIADMLANDLILGWVNGKYEIGPRALGNRSILAAPFRESTRMRLNEIKQREQFRPIAPVCLEEDAARWFGCDHASPHMLYTYSARTDALAAVTHVNKTARIQTVSSATNRSLYNLLIAFKARTGYGVLCNTSLNFNGRGFINKIDDLSSYVVKHNLDGFVIEGRSYILKSSRSYQAYLRMPKTIAGVNVTSPRAMREV